MIIKVLGSGCKNCKKLLENVNEAVKGFDKEIKVMYVTDMMEIANSGLMRTPGLIIDGKIVSYGKVLTPSEVASLIEKAL